MARTTRAYGGLVMEMAELWRVTRIRRGDYRGLVPSRAARLSPALEIKTAWSRMHGGPAGVRKGGAAARNHVTIWNSASRIANALTFLGAMALERY